MDEAMAVDMTCEFEKRIFTNILYAVVVDSMAIPPAIFMCRHCAEAWAGDQFVDGFDIRPLTDTQLVGYFLDEIANVKIVHGPDNPTTA